MIRITRAFRALLVTLVFSSVGAVAADNTWDYSVRVSCSVKTSPATITLTWPQDTNGTPVSFTVYRKAPDAASWGRGTTLRGSATSFVDTRVESGHVYEYRIVKQTKAYRGFGYIMAGIQAPLVDQRGKLILVVDDTFATSLAPELKRLEDDIAGDGWTVIRRNVRRSDSVATVKSVIKKVYDSDPANVKALFLFGHIAVPYSGQFNPDGHPDHMGAWPADAFYGDMDGIWTDETVNYTQTINTDAADAARISNHPGDGKFDQIILPSAIELQVGRVDLANMPGRTAWDGPATFPSETELLRNYLNKDHNFRHRLTNPPRRAVLGDYFGIRGGEAFAASGFRSFAPLVGPENVRNLNLEFGNRLGVWIPELAKSDYLLAYGCGPGNYTTMAGIGNSNGYNDATTTEFVGNNIRAVFNLLFGSWLGDWDHEDDFLRAPLATDYGLVSVWSGRPHWFMHPLGLGETVGYTARLAQNNDGLYETHINSAAHRTHIALMGDPTLRLHPVVPVGNLQGTMRGNVAALTWAPSSDTAIIGYHVYRGATPKGPFTRLTPSPVATTRFSDSAAIAGAVYMVRAIKLESTPSGSYENAAQGTFWSSGTATDAVIASAGEPSSSSDFSPDAAPIAGSANAAALTIASSGSTTSRDAGAASGEATATRSPSPTGNTPAPVINAPAAPN